VDLVSLEVERFGCIAKASIRFKPGLNVLHGANEVGKSSVAQAIRFALLLPSSSREAQEWVPWAEGGDPTIALVFRTGDTEYYRVKKTFCTNTASLERSFDGLGWANLARGREVEARVRALLQWGIPEPGGAKAPKGLPESFLASALLADQAAVLSVFATNLDGDGTDSGRAQIRAALQAIAQDPLFKSVLDAAQARVDAAFTPTGQRRRGAGDPFKKMAEEVAAIQRERDEAWQAADAARLLAQRVVDLQRDTARAEGDLHEARTKRERLELVRARQNAYAAAAAARKDAQALVDAVGEAKGKTANAAEALKELESRLPVIRSTAEEARRLFDAANVEASVVRKTREGELAQEETKILRERDALRTRRTRADSALDLRTAALLRKRGDAIAEAIDVLEREIATLEGIEPWLELQAARSALVAAERAETEVDALMTRAIDLRGQAKNEWPSARSALLPDAKRLGELRRLRGKLDVAEAKLDVGLFVEVRGVPSVSVSVDDAPLEIAIPPLSVEGRKSAKLKFAGGGEVLVRGGRPADREYAETERAAWHKATSSLFQSVGVADFAGLEEVVRIDAEGKTRGETLEREAVSIDAKRLALGTPAAEKQRYASRIAELGHRLHGHDVVAIEAAAKAYGAGARAAITRKTTERETRRNELAKLRAEEASLRERAAPSPAGTLIDDLDAEIEALRTAAAVLDQREGKLREDCDALDVPPGRNGPLEAAARTAQMALEDALQRIKTVTSERDIWGARLQERLGPASAIRIEVLKSTEDAARRATINDGAPVEEVTIVNARDAEETTKNRHEILEADLRKAEGGLLASGGAAASERVRELEAALRRAHEKQSALEDEHEAWRLLTDTLKDAERAQATHLGNVLAPDLIARLQSLVGTRYSRIALGPNLGLEGIDAAGGRRDLGRLSIGTREQISTLFRLCLAERLKSALLLDDQLVQSDPERLRWFRSALRQTAGNGVQVIVLTCRPDDYLEPAESSPPHAVDLSVAVAKWQAPMSSVGE
jgi:DNA repair exonuclease SbcCD ATPase subunit